MQLTHFTALVIYAFFASIVFGITQRSTPRAQVRYAAYCFSLFVGLSIVGAWAMWLLRH